MSRLLKNASQTTLDRNIKQLLLSEYSKFYREEFSKSSLLDRIPEEHREQFLNTYLDNMVYSQAYLEDYDFIFNPIEDVLNDAAKSSVENAGNVFVEQFLEELEEE